MVFAYSPAHIDSVSRRIGCSCSSTLNLPAMHSGQLKLLLALAETDYKQIEETGTLLACWIFFPAAYDSQQAS